MTRAHLFTALLAVAGCRSPGDNDTGDTGGTDEQCALPDAAGAALVIDGSVQGDGAPDCGRPYLAWAGDTGDGDVTYVYGEGVSVAGDVRLLVDDAPPDAATFGGRAGIGFIALLPWDRSLDEGIVDDDTAFDGLVGASMRHAVVWRPADAEPSGTWLDDFPAGLSCGQCVEGDGGGDTLQPVACEDVVLQTGALADETDFCEWS